MTPDSPGQTGPGADLMSGLSRRRLLQIGASGVAVLGASPLLAACGGGNSPSPTGSQSGKPVRGGTLTVGARTGGPTETLNPGTATTYVDILRVYQVFDPLFFVSDDVASQEPGLALSAKPNQDASVWTLKLRDGVKWHDGKAFSADDVVWTVHSWSDPGNYANAFVASVIDFKGVRKKGPLEVEIRLQRPVAEFPSILTMYNLLVIPNGATPKSIAAKPIGTGAFKVDSFKPGAQSVFSGNKDYWRVPGGPYLDRVVIDSTFSDTVTQFNALQGGQTQLSLVPTSSDAKQAEQNSALQVVRSPGTLYQEVNMRVDQGPFADVRVRQAMKLLTDRKAMVDNALRGYGSVGNDNAGRFARYFADDITADFDPEKAKSLLKASGNEGMRVDLPVPGGTFYADWAALWASQAKAAGVQVNLKTTSLGSYFTSAGGFLTRPFATDGGTTWPSMTVTALVLLAKNAPYGETHWADQQGGAAKSRLIDQAIAMQDSSRATELWHEVQQQQQTEGGQLIWGNADWIDIASTRVGGLKPTRSGPLNGYQLAGIWRAS